MNIWLLILALALSTAIPRIIPALFISRIDFPPLARKFLLLLPSTVMAALIFPGVFQAAPGVPACAATILVSTFCGWKNWPPIIAVLASAAAVWLLLAL